MNCRQPRPPWGIGAPCWLVTSKNVARVVDGVRAQNFHALVFPIPISTSLMLPSFFPPLTHGPMAPEIFSSRLHFTSSVALNAILNSFLLSLEKTRWYVCLKREELKESPMTMLPPVMLQQARISRSPVWSRLQAYRSMACPLSAALLAKVS